MVVAGVVEVITFGTVVVVVEVVVNEVVGVVDLVCAVVVVGVPLTVVTAELVVDREDDTVLLPPVKPIPPPLTT